MFDDASDLQAENRVIVAAIFAVGSCSLSLALSRPVDAAEMTRRYLMAADGTPAEQCLSSFYWVRAQIIGS